MILSYRSVVAAAALMMAVPAGALAADYVTRTIDVAYGDLDLSTTAGRSELNARIDQAASMACGGSAKFATGYRDAPIYHEIVFEQCRDKARDRAVASLQHQGVRVARR